MGLGVGSIVADVLTLGTASLAVGAAKVAVKQGVKAVARSTFKTVGKNVNNIATGVRNQVPDRLARVVRNGKSSGMLGRSGASDVFVTAADDITGLNANQIAKRLTIPKSKNGFQVIEFNTPRSGISSPINRTNPGFVGFGRTAGGAREFSLPNQIIPNNAVTRIAK